MENRTRFIDATFGDFLDETAKEYSNHEAFVHRASNVRYTYRQLADISDAFAKGLMKIGVKRGDHVAIWATNCPEWVVSIFATAKIGAVLVAVNTNYKTLEFEYLMRNSDASTVILMDGFKDSDYMGALHTLCPEISNAEKGKLQSAKLPKLRNIISLDGSREPGMYNWDEVMELGKEVPHRELKSIQASLSPQDVVNIQYTSGTTGHAKGVMLTHYNILNNGLHIGDRMAFTSQDRLLIPVPFFHCFGLVLAIMASVTHATAMVAVNYFRTEEVLRTIQEEHCTALHGVPTMFILLLEHPDFDKYDYSALRTGIMAGSPCPVHVMKKVMEKMGMQEITITYGQTEASPAITMTTIHDSLEDRVATVGTHMPGVEVKIVDTETGAVLPPGEKGELCSRGYNTMKGYYKMSEETSKAIDGENWLHTGDLAVSDARGYYKIMGRMGDIINRGGENIDPREIEELLYTHEKVKEVQVVGAPDRITGEEVVAFVIKKQDAEITEKELRQWTLQNISRHKVPKRILFLDSFPMTASGKIQKYKLREIAARETERDDK